MATQKQKAIGAAKKPLAAATAGLVVGLVVGGARLVRTYDWTTEWTVDASPADVFALFNHPDEQARWWPSMVVERTAGGTDGTPLSVTYRVIQAPSVRRLASPFVIHSTQTEAEPNRRTRAVVTGDLAGVLDTLFFGTPQGGTRIMFHWYVRVCKPVLNLAGYVAMPLFRASHDHVMQEGQAGLRAYFAQRPGGGKSGATAEMPLATLSEQS